MKKSAAQCIQSYQLSCILIKLSFRPRATGKSNRLILHLLEEDCFENGVVPALVEWRRWTCGGLGVVGGCEDGRDSLSD